jgi:hypothetical protein
MPLAIGQILNNRYRIVRLIGQGGFGAVYRAWDLSLKQPCALKENLDASPEAQRQFEREATLLAGLRHPNLPRVTDYFFLPGQGQYLVMDFIDGYSLVEAVKQNSGPLPESRALDWIEQVCNALTYLHSQKPPIIHRDIKPQNILITPAGQVMLVDFGISKIYDPVLSTTGGARGVTPGFSPPEQYGRARTDPRSDLYALSATLYYLLTAHEPPDAIERMVHNAPLTPPIQYNPVISPAVDRTILRALETDSQRRFPSIKEFRQALEGQKAATPSVQIRQATPASASNIATPAPATPHIRVLPPVQAALQVTPLPAAATAIVSKRPRRVTAIAIFCILFGIDISLHTIFPGIPDLFATIFHILYVLLGYIRIGIVIFGLIVIAGGVLMLSGKNMGRQIILGFSILMPAITLYSITRYGFLDITSAIITFFAFYSFFYLFRVHVRDYFSPLEAPHSSNPTKVLEILGRLHILLGFWLLLPILIGVGMLVRRNREMWWSAYLTTALLCLISLTGVIGPFFGLGLSSLVRGASLLIFSLESQVWLYLRRPEVHQLYP